MNLNFFPQLQKASAVHKIQSTVGQPEDGAESDEECLEQLETGKKHIKIKLEEIAPGSDLPGTSISSSSACQSIESDVKGLEEPKSGEKKKRKTKCSSPLLPLTTICSSLRITSEASSVHEHKTEFEESLEDSESGRRLKKIKLEEIAPETDLPGPSSSSSSAYKNTESDVKVLEVLESGEKHEKSKSKKCTEGSDPNTPNKPEHVMPGMNVC
ncbi:hypothetical protein CDAR_179381 [Caerostris darwini]|uniref:Uncharacterized protein n=1 Tax=Caerostris darwini TaxID=1538125 RepID=A0AAV4SB73_9ARAC|nr:hypothetical protein CDAR_179381 [Caerostris darwini]